MWGGGSALYSTVTPILRFSRLSDNDESPFSHLNFSALFHTIFADAVPRRKGDHICLETLVAEADLTLQQQSLNTSIFHHF